MTIDVNNLTSKVSSAALIREGAESRNQSEKVAHGTRMSDSGLELLHQSEPIDEVYGSSFLQNKMSIKKGSSNVILNDYFSSVKRRSAFIPSQQRKTSH